MRDKQLVRTACILFLLLRINFSSSKLGTTITPASRENTVSLANLIRKVTLQYYEPHCLLGLHNEGSRKNSVAKNLVLELLIELFPVQMVGSKKGCENHVVFLDSLKNLSKILAKQDTRSKVIVVTEESVWEVKDYLKTPHSRAYPQLLVVTPSISQRSRTGTYLLYTHRLFTGGSGTAEPLLLTSWMNNSITLENVNLFPDKLRGDFMGHQLLVSVIENPPFAIKTSLQDSWDGLEVRLLRLAAAHLNLTIEFADPRSPAASTLESAKNDVLYGLSSAAIGGIYHTIDINDELYDTTTPHAEDCAAFISLALTALPKYRAILGPFQPTVWLLLCLSYFILIVPLCFNSNYTIISLLKYPKGLDHVFWFVFSTYTNSFYVKSPLLNYGPAKNSITILLGIYWVFTIIVTACYTGSIVSFITLPAFPEAKESAADLLAYRYRVGTLNHNGWEKWFNVNKTDDPFLKSLFRKIEYVPTVLEGVQNASRAFFWPYAFLASKTSLDYITQTDFAPSWTSKRTLMHISKECFVRYNVIQLYPSKSLYTKSINGFIIRATEAGLIDLIFGDVDWQVQRIAIKLNKQITKRISQKIRVEERTLTVEDTQGMFMLLGIGFLLAFVALSFESLTSCLNKRKTGERNESEHLNSNQSLTTPMITITRALPNDNYFRQVKRVSVVAYRKSV